MRVTLVLGMLALIIVAVSILTETEVESPGDSEPEETATSEPAAQPTEPPRTSIDAGEHEDPRDVLIDLLQVDDRPNPQLVYRYLPARFQVIEYQEDWVNALSPVRAPGYLESPEEFEVEEYEGYRLVRSRDNWLSRWVFVVEDGEWRYDPGDRRLLMASAQYQQGSADGFSYGMALQQDYNARSRSEPDDGNISPLIRGRMEGVGVHDVGVDVSMVWEFEPGRDGPGGGLIESHALSDAVIPLNSVSWQAGDEAGGVEFRWTDGGFDGSEVRLHGWPDREMAQSAVDEHGTYAMLRYGTSFRLIGVPADAEQITLRFEQVIVGPFEGDGPVPDGETITYTWIYTFPQLTTDPVMAGESPEPLDTDDSPDQIADSS